MVHTFDSEIAKEYGINAAVILQHIAFWIAKNEANEQNYHDGHYWTYNSINAFETLFPYLSNKQIRAAIAKLIDEELIITGNYNQMKYDRTLWYALTEKGKSICRQSKIHLPSGENGNSQKGKPIPDNKPYIYTDNNTDIYGNKTTRFIKPSIEDVRSYCEERKNGIDAQRFIDYYEARGWMIGKNKMKDWKAAVRTWERNNKSEPKKEISQEDEDFLKMWG